MNAELSITWYLILILPSLSQSQCTHGTVDVTVLEDSAGAVRLSWTCSNTFSNDYIVSYDGNEEMVRGTSTVLLNLDTSEEYNVTIFSSNGANDESTCCISANFNISQYLDIQVMNASGVSYIVTIVAETEFTVESTSNATIKSSTQHASPTNTVILEESQRNVGGIVGGVVCIMAVILVASIITITVGILVYRRRKAAPSGNKCALALNSYVETHSVPNNGRRHENAIAVDVPCDDDHPDEPLYASLKPVNNMDVVVIDTLDDLIEPGYYQPGDVVSIQTTATTQKAHSELYPQASISSSTESSYYQPGDIVHVQMTPDSAGNEANLTESDVESTEDQMYTSLDELSRDYYSAYTPLMSSSQQINEIQHSTSNSTEHLKKEAEVDASTSHLELDNSMESNSDYYYVPVILDAKGGIIITENITPPSAKQSLSPYNDSHTEIANLKKGDTVNSVDYDDAECYVDMNSR